MRHAQGQAVMSAIRLDHVSKRFALRRERPRSFQELFLSLIRLKRAPAREKIWALYDVSLEIEHGSMVGIIGDNGAGKSTLLKLLARIIEPTSGQISVEGRISALLELGAGFHPDLTGRENIHLNGSILGFSRGEVDSIFADIVAFSELERFIDVPVKHYSSGMYMRLAFSIAIHVRPDVLLVDEILAVGDQSFQLRCLDRINQLKREGVTIVLITHDLSAVRSLCDRAIWLEDGQIQAEGDPDYCLEKYLAQVKAADREALSQAELIAHADSGDVSSWRWGSREAEIVGVQFLDDEDREQRAFETGDRLVVRIHYSARRPIEKPQFGLALYHANGFHINGPNTVFAGYEIERIDGQGYIDHVIDSLPLLAGTYSTSVSLYDYAGVHAYDHHHQAYTFRVNIGQTVREQFGSILIPATWRLGSPSADAGAACTARPVGRAHLAREPGECASASSRDP
jgi:lipopolysaccharide transport system ATP-binding protein